MLKTNWNSKIKVSNYLIYHHGLPVSAPTYKELKSSSLPPIFYKIWTNWWSMTLPGPKR